MLVDLHVEVVSHRNRHGFADALGMRAVDVDDAVFADRLVLRPFHSAFGAAADRQRLAAPNLLGVVPVDADVLVATNGG